MADLTISIANSINSFGPAPSDKWGTGTPYNFTWGVSKWGEGTEDLQVAIEKVLSSEGYSISDDYFFNPNKGLSESLPFASETTSEFLLTGNGWNYVFVAPVIDAENREIAVYTAVSGASVSYTCGTATSPTWSST